VSGQRKWSKNNSDDEIYEITGTSLDIRGISQGSSLNIRD